MRNKIKEFRSLWAAARQQGVSMQRRLRLYWLSMAMVVFALLLLLLSLTGSFSDPARKASEALTIQQRNMVSTLSGQMNSLTAQCVALSETTSSELSDLLLRHSAVFEDLNDNQAMITELEEALHGPVYSTLCSSDCSGVFVLLDATVNTDLEQADESRMGLYLRYSNIHRADSANQHLIYYRGSSEVAHKQQIQMHNRWNLEFDTSYLPGYDTVMSTPVTRLADGSIWSERVRLKDTWEDVILLYVPVLDGDRVRGICGVEISQMYFRLSYPVMDSNYGGMVTVLAPVEGDRLLLDGALLGESTGTMLEPTGTLQFREDKFYNTYTNGNERYIGYHQTLECATVDGRELAVVTLLPENGYLQMAASYRNIWIFGSLLFLLCMVVLVMFLSRRFVNPIVRSIRAIQESPTEKSNSGISEIDELLAFIHSKAGQSQISGELPPNIEDLFAEFAARVATLTPMERKILQYYIDGYEIGEIAQRAYISVNTAKKHNSNIYKKLGVSTREELMLYIDLFRRCGKLDQIIYPL